jgi:hypothetical protein
MYQYYMYDKALIQPYKLGRIDTRQFLQNLLHIFSFLRGIEEDVTSLNRGRSYSHEAPFALLEEAWNAIIDLDETRFSRFPMLVAEASEVEPIYLISNTNELNVLKILRLLKEKNPDIQWVTPLDLSVVESKAPIQIAPNIFLCLSYRYQLFKSVADNRSVNPHSTMSLLTHLVTEQLSGVTTSDIRVVSQFDGDLDAAADLGISAVKADTFFNDTELHSKKTKQF